MFLQVVFSLRLTLSFPSALLCGSDYGSSLDLVFPPSAIASLSRIGGFHFFIYYSSDFSLRIHLFEFYIFLVSLILDYGNSLPLFFLCHLLFPNIFFAQQISCMLLHGVLCYLFKSLLLLLFVTIRVPLSIA